MRILLTGAAGFVGRHLLARLKQRKHFVRALSRPVAPARKRRLDQADERIMEPLTTMTDWKRCLAGIDMVVHLADGFNRFEHLPGSVDTKEAKERLQTTIALADATARRGICFVYLSTVKAMCGPWASGVLVESMTAHPHSLYGKLKLAAEAEIMKAADDHGSKAVILRFPIVFGAGVGGNMERLLALANTPFPLPFKGLESRRSLISIHSLIEAVMKIVERDHAAGGVFLVHDGAVSSERLIRLLRNGLGRAERLFAAPPLFWKAVEPIPGAGEIFQRLTHPLELDDRKFRTGYDWQPEKSLETRLTEYASNRK